MSLAVTDSGIPDVWHVQSQSREGVHHVVTRSPLGLWSCTCEWGRGSVRLNIKPCAHLRRMYEYLEDLRRKAG